MKLFKLLTFVLCCLFSTNCISKEVPVTNTAYMNMFSYWNREFSREFKIKTNTVSVIISSEVNKFRTVDSSGEIRPPHALVQDNIIYFNEVWLKTKPSMWKVKKVYYHELGHLLLNLDDDPESYSIMNKSLETINDTGSNWGYLLGELKIRYINKKRSQNEK